VSRFGAVPLSFLALLSLAAGGLNWLWEMAQMPAFVEMAGRSWRETTIACTVAAVGDVVITLAIYGVGALAAGTIRWGTTTRWNVYVTAAVLGGASAAAFEWFSLATGRWHYNDYMPVVPVLNVGLWPLMQLSLLVPLSFLMAHWFTKSTCRERP
jgi:hypothetical protein